MSDSESLYRELKPEIEQLAEALFGASQVLLRRRGSFLPPGALRTTAGDVQLIMAAPENLEQDQVSTIECCRIFIMPCVTRRLGRQFPRWQFAKTFA